VRRKRAKQLLSGFISKRFDQTRNPIGPHDVLLAGHALALGAVLVTNNVREFTRIPRFTVEDWQTPGK
jgi:predicted nucleic acid-binding protein